MAQDYRRHGKDSPFSYKSTGSTGPEYQQSRENVQTAPTNYPQLGEQHPEGSQVKGAVSSQNDSLNFGWFTVPGSTGNLTQENVGGPEAAAIGGAATDNSQVPPSSAGSRPSSQPKQPPSRSGSRPASHQSNPPQDGQYPPSRAGHRPDSQGQGQQPSHPGTDRPQDRLVIDHSASGQEGGFYGQEYQPPPQPTTARDQNIVMDWPISRFAQEQMARFQRPSEPTQCQSDSGMPGHPASKMHQVPPTPMPPLQWDGYKNTARPTYASWHEQWHQHHDHAYQPHHYDTNYNNNRGWITTSNKNNNNTNEEDSRENSGVNYSGGKKKSASHVRVDAIASPQTRRLTTLPLYGKSETYVAKLYSPNAMMKWEEIDDEGQILSEHKHFRERSFLERIRSGILMLLSLFSCLNIPPKPGKPGPKVKLLKYNRFDKNLEKTQESSTKN